MIDVSSIIVGLRDTCRCGEFDVKESTDGLPDDSVPTLAADLLTIDADSANERAR